MQLTLGHQIFQLCGAMLILVAYIGHQLKWMNPARPMYNVMNGVGSGILGFYAFWPRFQAGFVVLEVVWTGISIYAFMRALRGAGTGTGSFEGTAAVQSTRSAQDN